MAKFDFTSVHRIHYFDHEALRLYEHMGSQKLKAIVEQMAESADSHLGYHRSKWNPDTGVEISYLIFDGPIVPHIEMRISYTPHEGGGEKEVEEEYTPYMWVGIAIYDASLTGGCGNDNPNCPFWGYPVEGRLYGLDPRPDNELDQLALDPFDINDSVETLGGEVYGGFFGQSQRVVNEYGGTLARRLITLGEAFFDGGDDFLGMEQGSFSNQDYAHLGSLTVSKGGLIASEGPACHLTAPSQAYDSTWESQGRYWQRSILLDPDGTDYGFKDDEGQPAPAITSEMCAIRFGGVGSKCNHSYGAGTTLDGGVGVVKVPALSGSYEISAFAQSFPCECTRGSVHIRMVLGKEPATDEKTTHRDERRAERVEQDPKPKISVIDFFPATIGTINDETARFFYRDLMLGGLPPCSDDPDNAFGGNPRGTGYWNESIYVNVIDGTWNLGTPTHTNPFFGTDSCGPTHAAGECGPECLGCAGESLPDGMIHLDFPGGLCRSLAKVPNPQSPADVEPLDGFGSVLFHMARVLQIDPINGCICYVMLVGNDGAAGTCLVTPFAYGRAVQANGVKDSLVQNVFDPNQGEIPVNPIGNFGQIGCAGFHVGELVTVIGFTNACNPCFNASADRRLLVARPQAGTNDFTQFFWTQLRCGEAQAVQKFWRKSRDDVISRGIGCVVHQDGSFSTLTDHRCFEFHPDIMAGDAAVGELDSTSYEC